MTPTSTPTPVVDAHHHLWRYTPEEYPWIDTTLAALQRDFTTADLAPVLTEAAVDHTVAVQARQSLAETRDLLAAARTFPRIAGVVGWLPLADPDALALALDEFAAEPLLRAARHVVQAEPAGFLDDPAFNAGIRTLTRHGLAFDLLLRADQLSEATRFVDRHPDGRFVLDHLAKPRIAAGPLDPRNEHWREHLRELARRPHVACKLSGLVTEAVWDNWSLPTLRPYLDTALAAFGPERLLAGSDWPVCLVATGYRHWWLTLHTYLAPLPAADRAAILGGNAVRWYTLPLPSATAV